MVAVGLLFPPVGVPTYPWYPPACTAVWLPPSFGAVPCGLSKSRPHLYIVFVLESSHLHGVRASLFAWNPIWSVTRQGGHFRSQPSRQPWCVQPVARHLNPSVPKWPTSCLRLSPLLLASLRPGRYRLGMETRTAKTTLGRRPTAWWLVEGGSRMITGFLISGGQGRELGGGRRSVIWGVYQVGGPCGVRTVSGPGEREAWCGDPSRDRAETNRSGPVESSLPLAAGAGGLGGGAGESSEQDPDGLRGQAERGLWMCQPKRPVACGACGFVVRREEGDPACGR